MSPTSGTRASIVIALIARILFCLVQVPTGPIFAPSQPGARNSAMHLVAALSRRDLQIRVPVARLERGLYLRFKFKMV